MFIDFHILLKRQLVKKPLVLLIIIFTPIFAHAGVENSETNILSCAENLLVHEEFKSKIPLSEKVAQVLPLPEQQYKLALVAWALMQPEGPKETNESRRIEGLFWASIKAIASYNTENAKALISSIVDQCKLQSGDLLKALELAYEKEPEQLQIELVRRGLK